MRRTVVLALFLAVLALPAHASAYAIAGKPWPKHRITYFNADRKLGHAVELAARAWNRSGADVRLVAAPRRRARVIIRKADLKRVPLASPSSAFDAGACAGLSDVGYFGPHRSQVILDHRCTGFLVSAEVIAHEFGHVLGLGHVSGRCALMSRSPFEFCKGRPKAWQYRCGFIQKDDLLGAIHLYGGHALRPKSFCQVWAPPAAPRDLSVHFDGSLAAVNWTNPPLPVPAFPEFGRPYVQAAVGVDLGTCPPADEQPAPVEGGLQIMPGTTQTTFLDRPTRTGIWCITVQLQDEFGRGGWARATLTVP